MHRVQTGASLQTAVKEAIKEVTKKGMYVEYPSGRVDTIETAILRAVRTGVNQANAKLVLEQAEADGQDLILVSSHLDARPSHQEWQGKIYSLSGKSKKYPEFRSATGYGTAEGLCGINCRHTIAIYYLGVTRNPFKRYNSPANKRRYEISQEQRKMENAMRKTKRRKNVFENSKPNTDDPELNEEMRKEAARLREQKKAYDGFVEKNKLKKNAYRTHVPKYDAAQLKNAVRKYAQDTPNRNIFSEAVNKKRAADFSETAKEINKELDKFCLNQSKWSGKITVSEDIYGTGSKEWDCSIMLQPNAEYSDLLHELLHARSISYYDSKVYLEFQKIEEGSVELFTEQICKRNKMPYLSTYEEEVRHLLRVNRRAKIFANDFDYARELINVDVPNRIEWLIKKSHQQYEKGIITAVELEAVHDSIAKLMERY